MPVSCVEQGRWNTGGAFFFVRLFASRRVRRTKVSTVADNVRFHDAKFSDHALVWNTLGAELGRLDAFSPSAALSAAAVRLDADRGMAEALAELERRAPPIGAAIDVATVARLTVMTSAPDAPVSPRAIQQLLDAARADVEELIATGRMSQAGKLADRTGEDFDPSYLPMFFTGDFKARLVLVHLNPKLADRLIGPRFKDFDAYLEGHSRFGLHHWGEDPSYRSAFDHKQVRFLRPFGVIDFVTGADTASKRRNCELAIDKKLQLELVPYASPSFSTHRFSAEILRPHFDRVLGAIAAYPRDYVLFCGSVFGELLQDSGRLLSHSEHRFRLPTTNGAVSKHEYRFTNVTIDYDGREIVAGIARSFAVQGLPMEAYARKCHELYAT